MKVIQKVAQSIFDSAIYVSIFFYLKILAKIIKVHEYLFHLFSTNVVFLELRLTLIGQHKN